MTPSKPGMHEHDLDLIAALADGSASDEAQARSLVEACPVCRAEYEAQTEVIALLAAAPRPMMTDMERAGLHRAVRSGLENKTVPSPATPWWQRLGYVAAGLLVVAGLFGVLQNSGFMGGADMATSATTTVAEGGAEAPVEEVPFVAQDGGGDAAPTTTAAASEETLATEEAAVLPFADLADEARAGATQRDTPSDEDRECLDRAGLDRHVVVNEVEESGTTYLIVMLDEPVEDETVFFVELPGCSIVFEDRRN